MSSTGASQPTSDPFSPEASRTMPDTTTDRGMSTNPAEVAPPVSGDQPAPPSLVADTAYPNVPDTVEPQQAASGPGQGTVVEDSPDKLKFKDQVNGYAKKIAGKVFRNEGEVEQGKTMLGEDTK